MNEALRAVTTAMVENSKAEQARPIYNCADCGQSTENWQLICDACSPNYRDAEPIDTRTQRWADETDGDCA